ncbi:MAG TPA: bacillithiol biosynthesis cysteine-adding enzyme BshC [Patescibacteria group bacterium]|nr:bacillithiol biosynthesis cysteine-adding enzyme BshC [Patescibacteria group bacterium]
MDCRPFPLARLPHASRLLADFLEDFPRVANFFAHPPTRDGVLEAARRAAPSPRMRGPVAEALREQNERFGADPSVERNLERFGNGAAAIVTGQQVGLFGGPAYTVYKALAALRLARELTESGVEAVPIFWMATEDHDLAEVNQCFWATHAGFERLDLPFPNEVEDQPVGAVALPAEVTAAVETACSQLEGPSTPSVTRALRESYRPGETMGMAFGRLMRQLFAGRGLLLIDPADARLRRLTGNLYLDALDSCDALDKELLARAEQLSLDGYHAQVRVTDESTLLFWEIDGRRFPVECRGGRMHAGDSSFSPGEFRQALAERPERASGNVLLRPVVQDALLGTAACIGGAAEVAYLAQAEVVYRRLGVPMPAVLARPGFTLVARTIDRLFSKYRLSIADVFEGRQHLRAAMERESLPGDLLGRFTEGDAKLREALENLRGPLEQLDPTLAGALETVERKMLYQYTKLHEKAGRALGARTGLLDRHERLITDLLHPHHELQERTLCFLPMLAWQGLPLVDALERLASPEAGQHIVVSLD